jgi:RNA polymerase sigma-70 factor (ECF subfamily)
MGHPNDLDEAAADFAALRPRLFGIAYRMMSSASEAEDLVQDTWLRWQAYDRGTVSDPGAFLATTITRLAINALQSARVRRETYIGPWLPEPVDTTADPYLGAERGEALSFAVLMLLEKLNPTERAAYVLREAFDYPYAQISDILSITEVSARQLVSRAKKHLADERRTPVPDADQQRLLTAFVDAARSGDLAKLEELLAADVISFSDGGGKVRQVSKFPVFGLSRVAKFHKAFASHFWTGVEVSYTRVNDQPAALLSNGGTLFGVLVLNIVPDGIDRVMWVMNPAKITAVPSLP